MARAREPWFDYLLRNKTIRTFLTNYAENDWQEVSKLAVLYGILGFNVAGGNGLLPLERLRDIVAAGATAATVESVLPGLNDKVEGLRAQLDDVALEIKGRGEVNGTKPNYALGNRLGRDGPELNAVARSSDAGKERLEDRERTEAASANVALRHAEKWLQYHGDGLAIDPQQMPRRLLNKAVKAVVAERALSPGDRPPSDWRTGDPGRTYSPPGKKRSPAVPGDGLAGAQYPSWWGDGEEWSEEGGGARADDAGGRAVGPWLGPGGYGHHPGGRSRSAPRPDRRPPRLAYSVQMEPGKPLWQNDLVTSRYRDVPSSGYNRTSRPRVPAQYLPPGSPPPGYGPSPYPPMHSDQGGQGPPRQPPPYGAGQLYGNTAGEARGPGGAFGPQLYVFHPSGAMVPVGRAPPGALPGGQEQQQGQGQQQEGAEGGRPAWKPIRTARGGPSAVQSRIREMVRADRAAARERAAARQRSVRAAVAGAAGGGGGGGGGVHSDWSRPANPSPGTRRTPHTPSDIAASLSANPYTAWFMDPEQQPQQPTQLAPPPPPLEPHSPQPSPFPQQRRGFFTGGGLGAAASPPASPTRHSPTRQPPSASGPGSPYPRVLPAEFGTGSGRSPAPRGNDGIGPDHPFYPLGPPRQPPQQQYPGYAPSYPAYGSWQEEGHPRGRVAWADEQRVGSPGPGWQGGPPAWGGLLPPQLPPQQQQHRHRHHSYDHHEHHHHHSSREGQWPYGVWGAGATLGRGWDGGLGGGGGGWFGADGAPLSPRLSPREEALQAVRPEVVRWSKSWVGDFGHLQRHQARSDSSAPPPRAQPPRKFSDADEDPYGSGRASGGGAGGGGGGSGLASRSPGYEGRRPALRERLQQEGAGDAPSAASAALEAADALLAAAAVSLEERAAAAAAAAAAAGTPPGPGLQASLSARDADGSRSIRSSAGGAGSRGSGGGQPGNRSRSAGGAVYPGGGPGVSGRLGGLPEDRVWGGVLGQVARLNNLPEPGMRADRPEFDVEAGQGEFSEGLGGGRWDFDRILAPPDGLTYQ